MFYVIINKRIIKVQPQIHQIHQIGYCGSSTEYQNCSCHESILKLIVVEHIVEPCNVGQFTTNWFHKNQSRTQQNHCQLLCQFTTVKKLEISSIFVWEPTTDPTIRRRNPWCWKMNPNISMNKMQVCQQHGLHIKNTQTGNCSQFVTLNMAQSKLKLCSH